MGARRLTQQEGGRRAAAGGAWGKEGDTKGGKVWKDAFDTLTPEGGSGIVGTGKAASEKEPGSLGCRITELHSSI